MDSDQGKLFIGGISWETSEDKLKDYFGRYGDVLQTVVMRDKVSGKPRGFGFVVFADPDVLDRVLEDMHIIDGRTVEVKKALSREEQQGSKAVNPSGGRNFGSSCGNNRTKKIFVGGLPPSLSEDVFRNYFETYETVTDVVIMFDQQTNRPRGFGFISFDTEDAVDSVMHKTYHDLCGKQVEVKRALPKDANLGGSARSTGGSGRGGSGSGGYQSYNSSSGGHSGSYNSLMDSSRYMQSQNTGGGVYPPYGGSAYNAAGYGYGATNNGMGGYGGTIPGYGGPAGGGYGNPNLSSAGYGSGPQGAPRGSWNAQVSSGYGNMGYGNAPWSRNTGTGSGANATGQSPSGVGGCGNQGYGYRGYGSGDGAYGNSAGYGAAVGTPNGNSGGVGGGNAAADVQGGGGGYGDASSNWGYGNQGWKSDPMMPSGNYGAPLSGAHGSQGGYAGGYGGAPTWQAQQ